MSCQLYNRTLQAAISLSRVGGPSESVLVSDPCVNVPCVNTPFPNVPYSCGTIPYLPSTLGMILSPLTPPRPQRLRACGFYAVDLALASRVMAAMKPAQSQGTLGLLRAASGRAKSIPEDKKLAIAMEAPAPIYTGGCRS